MLGGHVYTYVRVCLYVCLCACVCLGLYVRVLACSEKMSAMSPSGWSSTALDPALSVG